MTNREWLAGMSDEQLAEFICAIQDHTDYCEYCCYNKRLCAVKSCLEGVEDWLKQEHKEATQ